MAILTEKIEGTLIEVAIDSTNLKSAKYNTETKLLEIAFQNGSVYEYTDVPWSVFTKFRMAESQGKFFNENIGRTYKYTKTK